MVAEKVNEKKEGRKERVNISDKELIERYVGRKQSGTRIANDLGVSHPKIYRKLRRLGVSIRPRIEANRSARMSAEELTRRYVTERQTKPRIAKDVGVSEYMIHRRLRLLKLAGRWNRQGVIRARPAGSSNGWVENGYHRQVVNGENVYTHRLIANAKPGQVVHHRNGRRGDNRPENLVTFSSQAEHTKHHRMEKLRKAA